MRRAAGGRPASGSQRSRSCSRGAWSCRGETARAGTSSVTRIPGGLRSPRTRLHTTMTTWRPCAVGSRASSEPGTMTDMS